MQKQTKLNRNEKRQLVYSYLEGTNLTGAEKRKYRDWSVERIKNELGIRVKEKSVVLKENTRIQNINLKLDSFQKIKSKNTMREIVYLPLNQSRLAYLMPYTYVIQYEFYYGSDKTNRETDYMTIQDVDKMSYTRIIKTVKEYFKEDRKDLYMNRTLIVGSIKIIEAYSKYL